MAGENGTPVSVQAGFEICGLRCLDCRECSFTHVATQADAIQWGGIHQGHVFEMDCFYTKPVEMAGQRCRVTIKPKAE